MSASGMQRADPWFDAIAASTALLSASASSTFARVVAVQPYASTGTPWVSKSRGLRVTTVAWLNQATPAMMASARDRGPVARRARRDSAAQRAASGCVATYSSALISALMVRISSSRPLDRLSATTTSHTRRSSPLSNSRCTISGAPASPWLWSIRTVVSIRYFTGILPDPGSIPLGTQGTQILEDLLVGPPPRRRALEGSGVFREDQTC